MSWNLVESSDLLGYKGGRERNSFHPSVCKYIEITRDVKSILKLESVSTDLKIRRQY